MKPYILLFFCLYALGVSAQKLNLTFGDISEEEIEMKAYTNDPEAKAVILYDKGKSVFFDKDGGYEIRLVRHKRIKIFDKSAEEFTKVVIPYYKDGYGKTERVKDIKAATYNYVDGKLQVTEVNPTTIYDEQINQWWHKKIFVFPAVQDGSILEYRYDHETPFHFNLPDWIFQDKIPTVYSEYQVHMIPFYEYVFIAQGVSEFDFQESVMSQEDRAFGTVARGREIGDGFVFQDRIYTYVMNDVPAFKNENYISSIHDYIIKMDFQLARFHSPDRITTKSIISTWPLLNKTLLEKSSFGRYIKDCKRFAKGVIKDDFQDHTGTENELSADIIRYVKNNFQWNGINSKYASQSAKDFYNSKTGNAADINLFLIAMLEEANIEAEPVILSTRGHGKIKSNYPFDHYTNYVVALVNTSPAFLTDATEVNLPHDRLPLRCISESGIVVAKTDDKVAWLDLRNGVPAEENHVLMMELDTLSGNIKFRASILSTEYDAYLSRRSFEDNEKRLKKYYSEKLGDLDRVKSTGYRQFKKPYAVHFSGETEPKTIGSKIVVYPFLQLPMSDNKLTEDERLYPIDFIYAWSRKFDARIKIPESYKVSSLPEPYSVENELVKISLSYKDDNNYLSSKGEYTFKKAVYEPEEYVLIKQYFDTIIEKFNAPIVLEK